MSGRKAQERTKHLAANGIQMHTNSVPVCLALAKQFSAVYRFSATPERRGSELQPKVAVSRRVCVVSLLRSLIECVSTY
jgi:hypothetical protein